MKRIVSILSLLLILVFVFSAFVGCFSADKDELSFSLSDIPESDGSTPYVKINDGVPDFTDEDMTTKSYEKYSELDSLGRCGVAMACIGRDIMPTEERGSIGSVKPSGWQTVKYDIVDGKYLYNRCHLIGYQLTGENANKQNLITGTRYMNVDGMLPFENMVADYVKETNNHVIYRVTPIYDGSNLVASGVLMEAKSVEDDEICFCVYVYNAQAGVVIDYKTGESRLADDPLSGVLNGNHDDSDILPAAAPDSVVDIYEETVNGDFSGCLIVVSTTGSSGKITLAVDISENGSVVLVTVISGETLQGSTASAYIASFNGATLDNIDGISLISHSDAKLVKESVKDALEAFKYYTDAEKNGEIFIINKNTKKFHKETCSAIRNTSSENKQTYIGYAEDLIESGYTACGICKPANKD